MPGSRAGLDKYTVIGPVYPYRGGIAHYTTRLAQSLQEEHPVQVISFRRQYPAWLYPGQSDRDPSQNPLLVQAEYPLDPILPWTWGHTARQITQFMPYLAIIQWWTTFWAPAFVGLAALLKRNSIPLLFLVHNVLPHEPRLIDPWLARLTLRAGDAYIVGTPQEQERLLRLLPKAQVQVYPHPVYDVFSDHLIPQEKAKEQLGLPADRQVVLFFGIVRPYKGLKYLIEALAALNQRGISLSLVVAGEFWEAKRGYTQQIERLHLSEQVYLLDRYLPNEEIPVVFGAADVYVAPYIGGTQSGALKLAMGYGLPLVASRNVVDEDMIHLEDRGVFFTDPGDVQGLASAIARALSWQSIQSAKKSESHFLTDNGWIGLVKLIENIALRIHNG